MSAEAFPHPGHHKVIEGEVLRIVDHLPETHFTPTPEAHTAHEHSAAPTVDAARHAAQAQATAANKVFDITSPTGKLEASPENEARASVPKLLGRFVVGVAQAAADEYRFRKGLRSLGARNNVALFFRNLKGEVAYRGLPGGVDYIGDQTRAAWDNMRYKFRMR